MTKIKGAGIQEKLGQQLPECKEVSRIERKSLSQQLVEWVDNIMPPRF